MPHTPCPAACAHGGVPSRCAFYCILCADTHQYLLCTVAVGRSYVLDDVDSGAKRALPPGGGFHSAYLHAPEGDAAGSTSPGGSAASAEGGADPGAGYRHTYIVFNGAQVLPRYVLHFSFSPADAVRARAHPINAINLSDIKARVSDALAVLGPAASAATERMLTEIGDTYERALSASAEEDPLLSERRRAVRDLLRAVDERLRAVQTNAAAVEEALYSALQMALGSLQEEAGRKLNALLAEELELRRQLAQIDWAESFVGTLQDTLPPMSFIVAWEKHAGLRAALAAAGGSGGLASAGSAGSGGVGSRGLAATRAAIDAVVPDLRLTGRLDVVSSSGGRGGSALAASPGAASSASSAEAGGAAARLYGLAPQQLQLGGSPLPQSPPGSASLAATGTTMRRTPADDAALDSPAAATTRNGDTLAASAVDPWASVLRATIGLPQPTAAVAAPPTAAAASTPAPSVPVAAAPASSVAIAASAAGLSSRASLPASAAASASAAAAAASASASPQLASPASPSTTAATASSSTLGARLARYSIRREAERHRRQRGGASGEVVDASLAFPGSRLLETPADAVALYLTLPWAAAAASPDEEAYADSISRSPVPPVTRLLYSSIEDDGGSAAPPSVATMIERYVDSGARDPTVVIARAAGTGYVFGGYAADPWDLSGLFGGSSPRSFLFSITRDVKVPYTGRTRGPRQPNDDFLRQAHEYEQAQLQTHYAEKLELASQRVGGGPPPFDEAGNLLLIHVDANGERMAPVAVPAPRPKPFVRLDCLRSDGETLQWGLRDLELRGDLTACSSELETSYGIGLKPGSIEACTLLAGAREFTVDAIEMWAVTPGGGSGAAALAGGEVGGDDEEGGQRDYDGVSEGAYYN